MNLFSRVQNYLHGRKMNIILDEDKGWYYVGRLEVSEWKADKTIGLLTIDCDCEPYKVKVSDTVIHKEVSGDVSVILPNGRKPVIPTIDITGEINLTYGINYYSLSEGRYDLPGVQLVNGDNVIELSGTGTATFTYRERGL